jgi:hypothetical protein
LIKKLTISKTVLIYLKPKSKLSMIDRQNQKKDHHFLIITTTTIYKPKQQTITTIAIISNPMKMIINIWNR